MLSVFLVIETTSILLELYFDMFNQTTILILRVYQQYLDLFILWHEVPILNIYLVQSLVYCSNLNTTNMVYFDLYFGIIFDRAPDATISYLQLSPPKVQAQFETASSWIIFDYFELYFGKFD